MRPSLLCHHGDGVHLLQEHRAREPDGDGEVIAGGSGCVPHARWKASKAGWRGCPATTKKRCWRC
ncbi:hypothetical protein [Methanocrinis sp.]|uniref:hypothetical protein n=1 Tax=Methanocrinis sp. TaxID=3101522 RepID=UPI003D100CCF